MQKYGWRVWRHPKSLCTTGWRFGGIFWASCHQQRKRSIFGLVCNMEGEAWIAGPLRLLAQKLSIYMKSSIISLMQYYGQPGLYKTHRLIWRRTCHWCPNPTKGPCISSVFREGTQPNRSGWLGFDHWYRFSQTFAIPSKYTTTWLVNNTKDMIASSRLTTSHIIKRTRTNHSKYCPLLSMTWTAYVNTVI